MPQCPGLLVRRHQREVSQPNLSHEIVPTRWTLKDEQAQTTTMRTILQYGLDLALASLRSISQPVDAGLSPYPKPTTYTTSTTAVLNSQPWSTGSRHHPLSDRQSIPASRGNSCSHHWHERDSRGVSKTLRPQDHKQITQKRSLHYNRGLEWRLGPCEVFGQIIGQR